MVAETAFVLEQRLKGRLCRWRVTQGLHIGAALPPDSGVFQHACSGSWMTRRL